MGLLQQQHEQHKARQRRLYYPNIKPLLVKPPIEPREFVPPPVPLPEVVAMGAREARIRALEEEIRNLSEETPAARYSVRNITRTVAKFYGLRMQYMFSRRRTAGIVRPRQIAHYLCCQLTRCSLQEIGRFYGNMDHTTVLNSRWRIEDLRATDATLDADIVRLTDILAAQCETTVLPSFLPVRA